MNELLDLISELNAFLCGVASIGLVELTFYYGLCLVECFAFLHLWGALIAASYRFPLVYLLFWYSMGCILHIWRER